MSWLPTTPRNIFLVDPSGLPIGNKYDVGSSFLVLQTRIYINATEDFGRAVTAYTVEHTVVKEEA